MITAGIICILIGGGVLITCRLLRKAQCPYEQGRQAYRNGTPVSDNPYGLIVTEPGDEADQWHTGWFDEQNDQAA